MIRLGGLVVDPTSGRAWRDSVEVELPEIERRLLAAVAGRAPDPVGREELRSLLWPEARGKDSRALGMAWSRLRNRLGAEAREVLLTVRGEGLRLLRREERLEDHGIPPARTRFVGFGQQLSEVRTWLADGHGRWLTLTGVGGAGKSRTASEIARELVARRHPVAWVDLAPAVDGEPALLTTARRLGVEVGRSAVDTTLRDHLRLAGPVVLFLDNLEHVPEASIRIGALVEECPRVRVVATSRRRLGVRGEVTLRLQGLTTVDAPVLFEGLVRRYLVTPEPEALAPALVSRVCEASHGHPLTIELAVATLRRGTPAALHGALDRPVQLRGERSGRPSRHASFEAIFDYSWSLLTEPARQGLTAISLFNGGFTTHDAALFVGVEASTLTELVEQSLVDRSDDGLTVHPLIREVARSALGPRSSTQTRFQSRLLAWFGSRESLLLDDHDATWARVEARIHDLAAAWREAAAGGDRQGLMCAWPALRVWVDFRDDSRLGSDLAAAALQAACEPVFRAQLLLLLSHCTIQSGRPAEAGPLLDEVLASAVCSGPLRVRALATAALQQAWDGQLAGADHRLAEADAAATDCRDPEALFQLHLAHRTRLRLAAQSHRGEAHCDGALEQARATGVGLWERRALVQRASWRFANSRFAEAVSDAIEVERLARAASDRYSASTGANIRALGQRQLGRLDDSLRSFTRLLSDDSGMPPTNHAYLRNQRAMSLLDLGRFDQAGAEAKTAFDLALTLRSTKDQSFVLLTRGHLELAIGEPRRALATARERVAFEAQLGTPNRASQTLGRVLEATAALLAGESQAAITALALGREVFDGEPPYVEHLLELAAALVAAQQGDAVQTFRSLSIALSIAERSGAFAVKRALFPALLALVWLERLDLVRAAEPMLRDGPLTERWIYMPHLETVLDGCPGPRPLREPTAVLAALRADLSGSGPT